MNRDKIERHALYKFLAEVTGIKPESVKKYFSRNNLKVTDKNAILNYLQMNTLQTLKNDVCNHESWWIAYLSNPPKYKCKKCWEFYK